MAGFGWIIATLIAATAQTARNATQANLARTIGTIAATQVRFLFGLPFAVLFLCLVTVVGGQTVPSLTLEAVGFTIFGAVSQIAATALMLFTMKSQSFAVTTTWIKTEPVLVALIAAVVLGDPLTMPMLLAIAIATAGVILMSLRPGGTAATLREAGPALTGLLAGALFGAAAIGFRGGILALPAGDFLIRATTILALGLALQASILLIWLMLFDRRSLTASFGVWRGSLGAGFLGAFVSQFWFIGFSLTSAANVRTLALVEVIFAQAVSAYVFRQPVTARQMLGMAVIMLGIGLLFHSQR
jgi:drug/metabolite transporter (DMT)-like permease